MHYSDKKRRKREHESEGSSYFKWSWYIHRSSFCSNIHIYIIDTCIYNLFRVSQKCYRFWPMMEVFGEQNHSSPSQKAKPLTQETLKA